MQQLHALQSKLITQMSLHPAPSPNKQFILDLPAWVQFLQSQGHKSILALDNNDDLYSS
jgi:hypothetical protein